MRVRANSSFRSKKEEEHRIEISQGSKNESQRFQKTKMSPKRRLSQFSGYHLNNQRKRSSVGVSSSYRKSRRAAKNKRDQNKLKRTNFKEAVKAVRDIEFSSETESEGCSIDLSAVDSVSCGSSPNDRLKEIKQVESVQKFSNPTRQRQSQVLQLEKLKNQLKQTLQLHERQEERLRNTLTHDVNTSIQ